MESESIFYGQADNSGPEDFFLTEGKNLTEFELLDDFVETSPQQFIFAICIAVVAGCGILLNVSQLVTACTWYRCASTFHQFVSVITFFDSIFLGFLFLHVCMPAFEPRYFSHIFPLHYPFTFPLQEMAFVISVYSLIALACDRMRAAKDSYRYSNQCCVWAFFIMITVGSVAFHSVRFFETVTVDNPRIGAGYLIAKTNYAKSSYFQVYTHVLVPLNDILLPWLVLFLLCIALPIRYIKVQRENRVSGAHPRKRVVAAADISSPQHPDMMMSEEAIFGVGTRRLSFFHSKDAEKAKCRREQERTKSILGIVVFTFVLLTVVAATTVVRLAFEGSSLGRTLAELVGFVQIGTLASLFSFKNVFLVCLK